MTSIMSTIPNSDILQLLQLDRHAQISLVEQIQNQLIRAIAQQQLKTGSKLPSVRQMAKALEVSTFTVLEAYQALVSQGLLQARSGSGYYLAQQNPGNPGLAFNPPSLSVDTLSANLYTGISTTLPVGAGWLPAEWYDTAMLAEALRDCARNTPLRLRGYGNPLGLNLLRQLLAQQLSSDLFPVSSEQIILTHGASHAFDLILRSLCQPGDTVLLEEPCYSNLIALVRQHACQIITVPRHQDGLDLAELARVAALHQPKLMVVNTVLQNPLGTCLSPAQAHRLLSLAEQFNFLILEDDIYRDLCPRHEVSLAALDGLKRVLRVGSFSKALSPGLRVGSICASEQHVSHLLKIKMLTGLTTSEINERVVYHALSHKHYRRHLERLRRQLATAMEGSIEQLRSSGLRLLAQPSGGMFVCAGWPGSLENARTIAELALDKQISLAPNQFFCLGDSAYPWFRFNVAHSQSAQLAAFLRQFRPALDT